MSENVLALSVLQVQCLSIGYCAAYYMGLGQKLLVVLLQNLIDSVLLVASQRILVF